SHTISPASSSHVHSFFFFQSPPPNPDLHSFPTRRSSDLGARDRERARRRGGRSRNQAATARCGLRRAARRRLSLQRPHSPDEIRSEEHTSELQSLAYLVCRLLLEKKKQKTRLPSLDVRSS